MVRIVLSVLVLLPGLAAAVPMTFEYTGYCDDTVPLTSCSAIGLNHMDPVTGFIATLNGLDATDDTPNVLTAAEVDDFGFWFGDLAVLPASHSVSGFLTLNAAGTGFGGSLFDNMHFSSFTTFFGFSITAANTGSIPSLGLFGWTARVGFRAAAGPGSYTKVPEPTTLSLLGIGLIAMGFAAKRRKIQL